VGSCGSTTPTFNIIVITRDPDAFLAIVATYPFVEAWITGDEREHTSRQRPQRPARTAIGRRVSRSTRDTLGGGKLGPDGHSLQSPSRGASSTYSRCSSSSAPVIAFFITKRVCLGLQKKDREIALHGFESGTIIATPGGEYIEVHEQLDDYERWRR
jgi:ubiquinol-cytochrome c reductase cytochrome b subunit